VDKGKNEYRALSRVLSCGVDRVGDTPCDRPCDRGDAGKGLKPGGGPASRRCADGAMKRVPYARPLSPNNLGEGSGIWHQGKWVKRRETGPRKSWGEEGRRSARVREEGRREEEKEEKRKRRGENEGDFC